MLKKRISAVIPVKNNLAVQSMGFKNFLPVGKPEISAEFYSNWGADEVILLDLDASKTGNKPNFSLVKTVSKKCFVPLAVGGGIETLDDARKLVQNGADKIVINTSFLENPKLVNKMANVLGAQAVVVSIDTVKDKNNYKVFSHSGVSINQDNPFVLAKYAESLGAGEIFVNSVERDGSKKGYDINLIKKMSNQVNIPIIGCGGAGKPAHFYTLFTHTKASAAAAGNYFQFTEHCITITKSYLIKKGIQLRFDSSIKYDHFLIDRAGHLNKRSDKYLSEQRFEVYRPEKI